MGSGFSKMKKQARLMQEQFSQMQSELAKKEIEGQAGNRLVVVTLDGKKNLKKIAINPQCLADVEGLQDLIIGAFEDAASKLDEPAIPMF
jgi:DNA-binding YbaB/EbfC family protein